MDKKIKIIFIGTSDFGEPSLHALVKEKNFNIAAVITQADKKKDRKQILSSPPIKILAQKLNILVWQPEKIKQITKKIKQINPDLIIVVAYAQLIPKEILTIPQFGIINIHGSLLPKYRGASCLQAPILHGDKKSGITIIKIDSGLDSGLILKQQSIPIAPNDTTGNLFYKLSTLAGKIIVPVVNNYITGKITLIPQEKNKISYVRCLKKKDGQINWFHPAVEIEKFIRAMSPWPSAFYFLNKKRIIILEVNPRPEKINKYQPGEIFLKDDNLFIQCKPNSLIIKKLQVAGKKPLSANEFIRGYKKYIK